MLKKLRKKFKKNRGVQLVEYGLLAAGVTVMSAGALSMFGHKTADVMALTAAILPGAHADDNGPILSGKAIATTQNADGNLILDLGDAAAGGDRLANGMGVDAADLEALVVEP